MTCPKCSTKIFVDEYLDQEFYNGKYYDSVEGRCPLCGKWYRWTEVFQYSHDENIEEIVEE